MSEGPQRGPGIRLPGILLGIGLGGFVDGIVLHQILQWHHMLSSAGTDRLGLDPIPTTTVAGLELNTVFDGLFHVVTWLCVVAGVAILFVRVTHDRRRLYRSLELWGWVLAGWGWFNLVEGLGNHQILGIHHVIEGDQQLLADLTFLGVAVVQIIAGTVLARRGRRTTGTSDDTVTLPGSGAKRSQERS